MLRLLEYAAQPVLLLPRLIKRALVLVVDLCLILLSVWLAFYLRLDQWVSLLGDDQWQPGWAVLAAVLIALPLFITQGFYRAIFRYSGWPALVTVARTIGLYGLVYVVIFTVIGVPGVPRTIGIIQPILLLLAIGASRALARFWLGGLYQNHLRLAARPPVLIYGAGMAGRQLAAGLSNSHEMRVVGFLDDDPRLQGQMLNALPIYAPDRLATLIERQGISDVLLALPSAGRVRRNQILAELQEFQVGVRTLPSMTELAQGRVRVSDLRELDIDDLLGREPVYPDTRLLAKNIHAKVVMVTGAGGSIGSELCRQILALEPRSLLLLEHSEYALYSIHQELQGLPQAQAVQLVPLLGSVCDAERLRDIFTSWWPDTLYHAAAYKHVPLVEHNPAEGLRNNVLGTLITAQAAAEAGLSDFVLISTDKAVRPTNIMGASKRLAELVLQALAAHSLTPGPSPKGRGEKTRFSMVRFGNVLGSSGSVVPLFRQQIRDGGPVTLTHTEVIRYFMTIPEAAQLVIQAGAMAEGGDVFVLDMGEPVRIYDLARRMIELSGLRLKDAHNPEGDIELQVTGLRPGEKLYEELLIGNDPQPTAHPRILKAHEDFLPWSELRQRLDVLEQALAAKELARVRQLLVELVSGYDPSNEIVDWVYVQREVMSGE